MGVNHAMENLVKMKKAFERCGSEDDSYSQISTLSSDVCQAMEEILSAFSQWAETHLYACKNSKMHNDRMETRWYNIYTMVLGCDKNQSLIVSTTSQPLSLPLSLQLPFRRLQLFLLVPGRITVIIEILLDRIVGQFLQPIYIMMIMITIPHIIMVMIGLMLKIPS